MHTTLMMRRWLGPSLVAVVLSGIVPVLADGPSLSLLKARIIQLEVQVVHLQAEASVCRAQQSMSTRDQLQPGFKARWESLEKELGCALDRATVPPVCVDAK